MSEIKGHHFFKLNNLKNTASSGGNLNILVCCTGHCTEWNMNIGEHQTECKQTPLNLFNIRKWGWLMELLEKSALDTKWPAVGTLQAGMWAVEPTLIHRTVQLSSIPPNRAA